MKKHHKVVKKTFLSTFYKIPLSSVEKEVADESVTDKYAPVIVRSLLSGLLIIPAILFLDTTVLISVLIPVTMVAGTAWFAISLANMKKKFEVFGLELTTNMFEAFVTSIVFLGLLTLFSLLMPLFSLKAPTLVQQLVSVVLGVIVIGRLLFNILAGALKYDINDAMLTGQNEAAERFFKKSLSLLHAASANLREGKGLVVANYYLGLSFYEVFAFIRSTGVLNGKLQGLLDKSLELKRNPAMSQEKADEISLELIESFIGYCKNVDGEKAKKSFENLQDEFNCVKKNKNEPQEMVDTRLSTIFEEMAELLELQGESLFKES